MSRLLMIDNYDSFTWNLAQYFQELGVDLEVRLHDKIGLEEIDEGGWDGLVLSPGPGRPRDAGICLAVLERFRESLPILGVCLGHQSLAESFGGKIVRAPTLMHGKTSQIEHDDSGLFAGLPNPLEATRYHSLVVDPDSVPAEFVVNAWTDGNVIMGLRHRELPLHGVQFHPESILTQAGRPLLANFLEGLA